MFVLHPFIGSKMSRRKKKIEWKGKRKREMMFSLGKRIEIEMKRWYRRNTRERGVKNQSSLAYDKDGNSILKLCWGERNSSWVVKYYFFVCDERYGTLCIRENPGCLFIATNRDAVTHLTDAQEWAGLSFPLVLLILFTTLYIIMYNLLVQFFFNMLQLELVQVAFQPN